MRLVEELQHDGYTVIEILASEEHVRALLTMLHDVVQDYRSHARRNLLVPDSELDRLVASLPLINPITSVLGDRARPTKATFFDKTPQANWKVPWHQDMTIAVRERNDVPGFGPWSVKGGVPHVLAPPDVLQHIVALRLHLDDCDIDNGALHVLPGSHLQGRLSHESLAEMRRSTDEVVVAVPKGGAMLMYPLLAHASSSAKQPQHRRVLHIEYAAIDLPGGLRWAG
jgi:ectoine hydroxylase-related dioxygenase (phytanoyl-CoA dioxygenase family)